MAKGEIVINEEKCKGCVLCTQTCARGCISFDSDRVGPRGIPVARFLVPERCNACGVCGWLCPDWAIEVYAFVEAVG